MTEELEVDQLSNALQSTKICENNLLHCGVGSHNDNVETPDDFYAVLNEEFQFDHDPCPLNPNPTVDGLKTSWGKRNFVNPPYSQIEKWFVKAVEEMTAHKNLSVFLVPARPQTKYWQKYVWTQASELRFLVGGLKFKGYKQKLPIPLCLIIYDPVRPGELSKVIKRTFKDKYKFIEIS